MTSTPSKQKGMLDLFNQLLTSSICIQDFDFHPMFFGPSNFKRFHPS